MTSTIVRSSRSALVALLCAGVFGGTAWGSARAATAADIAKGKQLYESDCSGCHKVDGSGGVNLGAVTSSDLQSPILERAFHDSDTALRAAILDGKKMDGKNLNPVMPLYRGNLTSQQAGSIIDYLKTLQK